MMSDKPRIRQHSKRTVVRGIEELSTEHLRHRDGHEWRWAGDTPFTRSGSLWTDGTRAKIGYFIRRRICDCGCWTEHTISVPDYKTIKTERFAPSEYCTRGVGRVTREAARAEYFKRQFGKAVA